ncbi:MAG: FecR domain-containing protein [Tannerella sp.]|jgi:ferric-dicitrate binding protein FerR (iron transport regulator)|nr:FecR domain-containing protein [Tannerella sp.]
MMEYGRNYIDEIIIRYLDGSATPEDKVRLLQWLRESGKNRNDFNETRDLWLSCDSISDSETDRALQRLHRRILNEYNIIRRKRRPLMNWYQTAAVILVLLSMGYWISVPESPEVYYTQNRMITAKGSKGRFKLPDGTVVWLNSESRLVYPETFEKDRRQVELTGEGYFQVTEDRKKPFIVKTGNMDIEVLGTSFDISNFPFTDHIEVVLLSGSIKVKGDDFPDPVMLEPGQLLTLNKENHSTSIRTTKAGLHVDWIRERLVFDNTSLSDIIISLEGWYNIEIECPKTFADRARLSFAVRGENVTELFNAMSLIIPINYTVDENKIKILPK